ncbi:hypothetical protein AGLY_001572 [Aphis glycines]|uniref:HAT C-terminal dimerisation domain-containing protein n=1 Tax=Aphis glycines TaxID=307491 RepID=A0A6G0U624_APHGL|nr:hypothetical protein AGLY_001572 [Aphis glycines]
MDQMLYVKLMKQVWTDSYSNVQNDEIVEKINNNELNSSDLTIIDSLAETNNSGEQKNNEIPSPNLELITSSSKNVSVSKQFPGSDLAEWNLDSDTIDYLLKNPPFVNSIDIDFKSTKRLCGKNIRKLPYDIFERCLLNGERKKRNWLLYSKSKNALYCFQCLIFVNEHEKSVAHNTNVCKWFLRTTKNKDVIHHALQEEIQSQMSYWKNVLHRCLELISKFDPFIANHITNFGNKGRGNVSYLSSTICDEFISLMNSTPDITKVDQLTIIIRYIEDNNFAVERFLGFLKSVGHKAEDMENALLNFFTDHSIDLKNCREKCLDTTPDLLTIKNLCKTRWSSRYDVCKSLNGGYKEILQSLEKIYLDKNQRPTICHEARSTHKKINTLEFSFLLSMWSPILKRFDATSKTLQSENIDLSIVISLYRSLKDYIENMRNSFHTFLEKAQIRCGSKLFSWETSRTKKKSTFHIDDLSSDEINFSGNEKMKIETFLTLENIRIQGKNLVELDLETDFKEELIQFKSIVKDFPKECKLSFAALHKTLITSSLETSFPNIEIILRIICTLPSSNASGERSFSVLKRVKHYLRSFLLHEKMSNLSILCIESDLVKNMKWEELIHQFATMKSRKKDI